MNRHRPTATNDTERMARLWTKAQPSVQAFLISVIWNPAAVDDILQEVALVVVRKFGEFKQGTDFTAWAIAIARLKTMEYQRARGRDRHVFSDQTLTRLGNAASEVSDHLTTMRLAMAGCIEKLPEEHRRLLKMRYEEGLALQSIADANDVQPNTLAVKLRRIRLAVRACIDREIERAGA